MYYWVYGGFCCGTVYYKIHDENSKKGQLVVFCNISICAWNIGSFKPICVLLVLKASLKIKINPLKKKALAFFFVGIS